MITPEEREEMRKADEEIDKEFDTPEMQRKLHLAEAQRRYYLAHREERLAQNKKWQKEHPEKVKEYGKRSRKKHHEERAKYARDYRLDNPDKERARAKRTYERKKRKKKPLPNQHWKTVLKKTIRAHYNSERGICQWASSKLATESGW